MLFGDNPLILIMNTLSPLVLLTLASLVGVGSSALVAQNAPATPAATAPAAGAKVDFGDHVSSTLTTKAWAAYEAKDAEAVFAYTGKCRELYQEAALKQQAALTAPVPTTEKEKVFEQWALNDVGTCLFILGQTYEQKGNPIDALATYKFLVEKLAYAQCWDNKGWFWSPADAAKARIRALEFEAL